MVSFKPYGRSDVDEFFRKSGLWWPDHRLSWNHYPVLVFVCDHAKDEVRCRAFVSTYDFSQLPDHLWCQQQWPGKYSSDFFKFTVGQTRPFLPARTEPHLPAPAEWRPSDEDVARVG